MADNDRIKRNIRKMIDMGAPESDIDGYIASEGVTMEQLRGAPAAQPQGWGEWAGDVAKSAGTGLAEGAIGLVGLPGTIQDAMQGGVNWAAEKLTGRTAPKEAEWLLKSPLSGSAIQSFVEKGTGEFYEPKSTAGKYANTAAEFVPGALLGGGKTAADLGWSALKFGVVPGVASEAAGQATEGSAIEPYARVLAGLVAGIGSAALPGVKLATVPKESRMLSRALRDDGVTAGAVAGSMDDLGRGGMVMDLGPNTQRQAGALAATPGPAQKVIRDAVDSRSAGANARIINQVDNTLGPAPVPSRIAGTLTENKQGLDPLYEEVFRNAKPVQTQVFADDLDKMIRSHRGEAQTQLKRVRNMLEMHWDEATKAQAASKKWPLPSGLDTNPWTMLQTRHAIDDIINAAEDPSVVRVLTPIRQRVDGILQAAAPDIKKVDAMAQDLIRQGKAVDIGQQSLDSGRTALRPSEVVDAMSPVPAGDMIGPSGAPFRMTQGTRAEIERLIGTTGNDVVALKRLLKGEGSWNRDRLAAQFGQRKADELLKIMDREIKFAKTDAVVTQNSESAARIKALEEVSPVVGGKGPVRSALNFNFGDAAAGMIDWATGALKAGSRNKTNERLARLLVRSQSDPSAIRGAMRLVDAARTSGNITQEVAALIVNGLAAIRTANQPGTSR